MSINTTHHSLFIKQTSKPKFGKLNLSFQETVTLESWSGFHSGNLLFHPQMHSMHTLIFRLHQYPFIFPPLDHNNLSRLLHCSFWFQMHLRRYCLGLWRLIIFPLVTAPGCFQTFGKGAEALSSAPMTKDPSLNERSGYVLQQNPPKKKTTHIKKAHRQCPNARDLKTNNNGQNNGGGIDGASITGGGLSIISQRQKGRRYIHPRQPKSAVVHLQVFALKRLISFPSGQDE